MRGQRSPSLTDSTSASACASAVSLVRMDSAAAARSRAAASAASAAARRLVPCSCDAARSAAARSCAARRSVAAVSWAVRRNLAAVSAAEARSRWASSAAAARAVAACCSAAARVCSADSRAARAAISAASRAPRSASAASSSAGSTSSAATSRCSAASRACCSARRRARASAVCSASASARCVAASSAACSVARLASASAARAASSAAATATSACSMRAGCPASELRESGRLIVQAGDGRSGVAAGLLGMGEVAAHLLQPGGGCGQRLARPRLLGGDLLAGEPVALQRGARLPLGLAQLRQPGGGLGRGGARGGGGGGGGGHRRLRLCQGRMGVASGALDLGALDGQQLGLGGADEPGDGAVAVGLPGLTLQPLQLRLQLPAQILGAGEIGFGGAQLQLGLVAAGMQAGDAGGFLQDGTTVVRLGIDQAADRALAHQAGGMRAGGKIGEQRLHVARPRLAAVDAIDAAAAALNAPADLQLRRFMERRRRGALGVGQMQRDLGEVARGPVSGAGEDHVVHLAAAHGPGGSLAHRPAQRFHHVGLAATVRTDDAGQPGQDVHHRRLGEALEPGDAQTAEADRQLVSPRLRARRYPAAPATALAKAS